HAPGPPGQREQLPLLAQQRYVAEGGERTDGEAGRQPGALDQRVRQVGRVGARDDDDAGYRHGEYPKREPRRGEAAAGTEELLRDRDPGGREQYRPPSPDQRA